MQRNIQGNVQENRDRNVAFRNRSGLETMLDRVSDRVIQEVMRYMEDFAEMAGIEYVRIGKQTDLYQFKKEMRWNHVFYN